MGYKNKSSKLKKKSKFSAIDFSHALDSIALLHYNVHVTLADTKGNVLQSVDLHLPSFHGGHYTIRLTRFYYYHTPALLLILNASRGEAC